MMFDRFSNELFFMIYLCIRSKISSKVVKFFGQDIQMWPFFAICSLRHYSRVNCKLSVERVKSPLPPEADGDFPVGMPTARVGSSDVSFKFNNHLYIKKHHPTTPGPSFIRRGDWLCFTRNYMLDTTLYTILIPSAPLAAIFHILPVAFPFLSPGKRPFTNRTDFCGKILL